MQLRAVATAQLLWDQSTIFFGWYHIPHSCCLTCLTSSCLLQISQHISSFWGTYPSRSHNITPKSFHPFIACDASSTAGSAAGSLNDTSCRSGFSITRFRYVAWWPRLRIGEGEKNGRRHMVPHIAERITVLVVYLVSTWAQWMSRGCFTFFWQDCWRHEKS